MANHVPTRAPLSRLQMAAVLLAPAAIMASCFGGLLTGRRTFVFRDTSHYYFPLWNWIAGGWRRGEFPLWNPHENAGASLAADATASLFYPGKLLFLLPVSFDVAFNLFLLGHFVLAFWFTWRAARSFRWTASAATLAAVAYSFSGSVLIQHANPPYLIGAAWLPLAMAAGYHALARCCWRQAIWFAVALAMMILGDVQTAYHCVLILLLAWWFLRRKPSVAQSTAARWHAQRLTIVAGALLLAAGLAAVQILPAQSAMPDTVRAAYDRPRNIYEASAVLAADDPKANEKLAAGLFGKPADGSHHAASYQFSVGPWRWPELLWPNVSGQMFPIHRRWLSTIPAEGRVWSPSLYLGAIPFLLALSVWRVRRGKAEIRWLAAVALLSVLAALGWYGIGWIVHELSYALAGEREEPGIGPQVGGLYWLYSSLLPGYAYFRYPAKWLTVGSLAISLLAGYGLQINARRFTRRARRWFLGAIAASGIGACGMWLARGVWLETLQPAAADPFFGPLDAEGAWLDCVTALWQTLLVVSLAWLWLRQRQSSASHRTALLVAVTVLDLAVAQRWLTPTAPSSLWYQTPQAAAAISGAEHPRIYRSRSPSMLPPEWSNRSAADRLTAGMVWERDTLHAKHYLSHGIGSIDVLTPMRSYRHAQQLEAGIANQGSHALADFSVTHVIEPGDGGASGIIAYPHVKLSEVERPLPRVYLAASSGDGGLSPEADLGKVKIVHETANRIEFDVNASAPATLVVNDHFAGGWRAEVVSQSPSTA